MRENRRKLYLYEQIQLNSNQITTILISLKFHSLVAYFELASSNYQKKQNQFNFMVSSKIILISKRKIF